MIRTEITGLILSIFLASGCSLNKVKPSGIEMENTTSISDVALLTLAGNFKAYIKHSDQNYLTIKGDSAFLAHMSVEHKKNRLLIEARRNWTSERVPVIELFLTESPAKIELTGAAQLFSQKRLQIQSVQIDMAGATVADLNFRVNEIYANLSGASKLKLGGASENFTLNITGASQCDAKNFPSRILKTTVNGASRAEVFAIERLNATLSGASSLKYLGSPAIKSNISGNATLSTIEIK